MNDFDAARLSILLLVVVCVGLLSWLIVKRDPVGKDGTWPFEAKRLLTEDQAQVYRMLQEALPGMLVFPSVALVRMLYLRVEGSAKEMRERRVWRQRITEKSVDFVVCDQSAQVVAVVDLKTPEELRRASRGVQQEKERALHGARVRVVHWSSLVSTENEAIRQLVLKG